MTEEKKYGLRCLDCGSEIFSRYTHDFRKCLCGACFVDGGDDYFRAGWMSRERAEVIYKNEDGQIFTKEVSE